MSETSGKLYLIPSVLAPDTFFVLPTQVLEVIHHTRYFIAENARTARRFIKSTHPPYAIDQIHVSELDKHQDLPPADLLDPIRDGKDVGILSEAGCPGIADPGAVLVRLAHAQGIQVVPLVGPSSILLALMASGMGGQRFQFHGYLSPKKNTLAGDLRRLEDLARKDKATQIFIETPYRNQQVLESALHTLADATQFCIAVDVTAPTEWIRTMTVGEWKKKKAPELHKRPAVFCIAV